LRWRTDIRVGLEFAWQHPVVRIQTVVGCLQAAAGGAFMGQFVPWLDRVLGVHPTGDVRLGLLFAAWGVGGLAANTVLPWLTGLVGEARITLYFLPLSALSGLACALTTDWLAAGFLLIAWGTAYTLVVLNSSSLRQKVNTAARMLSFGVGAPVGALLGGVIAQVSGPRVAITGTVLLIGAAAVAAWLSPLRGIEPGELALAGEG
jgi:MFS family permease